MMNDIIGRMRRARYLVLESIGSVWPGYRYYTTVTGRGVYYSDGKKWCKKIARVDTEAEAKKLCKDHNPSIPDCFKSKIPCQ